MLHFRPRSRPQTPSQRATLQAPTHHINLFLCWRKALQERPNPFFAMQKGAKNTNKKKSIFLSNKVPPSYRMGSDTLFEFIIYRNGKPRLLRSSGIIYIPSTNQPRVHTIVSSQERTSDISSPSLLLLLLGVLLCFVCF